VLQQVETGFKHALREITFQHFSFFNVL